MTQAAWDSSVSRFYMTNSVAAEQDISPYVISVDGIPGQRTLLPSTTINDTGRKSAPGIQITDIRLELLYSDDALVGSGTVFDLLFADTTPRAWRYGPIGDTVGLIEWSGTALVRLLNEGCRVGSLVSCLVELENQGVVGKGTF